MGKRWVQIGKDGQPLARREKQRLVAVDKAKRYSPFEVEQMVAKALTAAGVDPSKVSKGVGRITPGARPIRKTASAIEADRQRQRQLDSDLDRQAVAKRRSELLSAGDRLGHMTAREAHVGRAAIDFERGDPVAGGEGAVTRLDLD
jgi:hypothetical protein